jgi:DNA uptake protein ComE-like DNA-binding protein
MRANACAHTLWLPTETRVAPKSVAKAAAKTPTKKAVPKAKLLEIVNDGSEEDLVGLPGVGPKTSARIIADRPFEDVRAT